MRKKNLNITGIVLIALGIFQIFYIYLCVYNTSAQTVKAESSTSNLTQEIVSKSDSDFHNLVGRTLVIDFQVEKEAITDFTDREKEEQFRDWLLFAILSKLNTTPKEINEILFDLPPIRYGYLNSIGSFEYGITRSCYVDGNIFAIVPPCNGKDYRDYLAHICDKHRKDLGQIPQGNLWVFEYELNLHGSCATLTLHPKQRVSNFFTEKFGYFTTNDIRGFDDLKNFLNRIDDITFCHIGNYSLELGGRKLNREYRSIGLEEISSLWYSEQKIQKRWEEVRNTENQFNAKWQDIFDRFNQRIQQLNIPPWRFQKFKNPFDNSAEEYSEQIDLIVQSLLERYKHDNLSDNPEVLIAYLEESNIDAHAEKIKKIREAEWEKIKEDTKTKFITNPSGNR
jgi:hypothetical protein